MLNNWDYQTKTELPDLITVSEFDMLTGYSLSSDETQKAAMIKAVSAVIRNYCGWHVGPICDCVWIGDAEYNYIDLPVLGIKKVDEVLVDGEPVKFAYKGFGGIRLDRPLHDDWGNHVTVKFTSGYDTTAIGAIVAQIVTNALVASPGIRNETVSGISVTYNQVNGISGGIRLSDSDKQSLDAYRISR